MGLAYMGFFQKHYGAELTFLYHFMGVVVHA